MSRCVVIGASGQLGRLLRQELSADCEVVATSRDGAAGTVPLDLSRPRDLGRVLEGLRPDWIVIAGAYCDVDGAERDTARCLQVNAEGPRAVAAYAKRAGAGVVHYSTETVFDGAEERAYVETDALCPVSNVYSHSKAEGERAVREGVPGRHLIIRTAWLYGTDARRKSFVARVVDTLRAGRTVLVPSDQWGTPTYAGDVAAATRWLLQRGALGTFHAVGPEYLDRLTLAQRICAVFGCDPAGLVAVSTDTLGQAAIRPRRIRLDASKLLATGAPRFHAVREGLEAVRAAAAPAEAGAR